MGYALAVVAYFCGSIPFGLLLARRFAGVDVRAAGSGNIGATNVARVVGKKLGAVVLLLDALKGAAPVLAARFLVDGPWWHAAVAFAAVLGHVFPVWLRFKGGKGVATAAGVLAVLLPWSALAGFVIWGSVMLIIRVSSIGSLLGAAAAVGLAFALGAPVEYRALAGAIVLLIIWTHRENVKRLLKGAEKPLS
ncbi:MAG: glycerol-3-phosphate 1-O-acyltransferase PlsY [Myxococcaceae bacterium]